MVRIILEGADNGVLKTVEDDNINGAGAPFSSKNVYEFTDDDETHINKIKFFFELAEDLGIVTGNIYDSNNLVMSADWGSSYTPTQEEINKKIEFHKAKIKVLQSLIKPVKK